MKGEIKMYISKKQEVELNKKVNGFVESNRKICWEAEFEKGEYCIGEKAVMKFIREVVDELP